MFKLPNQPSPKADIHELADFAELLAWCKGTVSAREIIAYLGREDDNDNNVGCDDNDDENANELDEVMNELERRSQACNTGYPFLLELEGTVLKFSPPQDNQKQEIYLYLLLSTRLNMLKSKIHAGIDGTTLLEEIAARTLQFYLGKNRSKSMVFGTAMGNKFEEKVNRLCTELKEGGCFKNWDSAPVSANDDRLDAVAWVPFSDGTSNQIIVFGQCKTGTTWEPQSTQLQPDAFIKRWTSERTFSLTPIRAYCISEAADRSRWQGITAYTGLLLDRCRLVDFCEDLEVGTLQRLRSWSEAAKATVNFS
ncbi:hypothetical protein [Pseudomonas yangonensis]|uniref:hypothetical protein n=1 Tax=Pseudomonas yangonensis TaxID=2579922 RepID=UPI00137B50AC|nr:hypothetical protein [Pseudomonas yangonensis]